MTKYKRIGERTFFSFLKEYGRGRWLSAAGGECCSTWPLELWGYFRGSLVRDVVSSRVAIYFLAVLEVRNLKWVGGLFSFSRL